MKMRYRYYSTQRPVAPGTFPKPEGNRVADIVNFDQRQYIEGFGGEAWGYIEYLLPLDAGSRDNYELKEAGPFYINKETGELLSHQAMLYQFATEYDGGDDTNVLNYTEYFEEVDV